MSRTVITARSCALWLSLLAVPVGSLMAQDPLAYADRGNRLEGHFRSEVSAPALEVLSFTRGAPLSTLSAPANLEATFFLASPGQVFVEGLELVPSSLYRMTWKQSDWPAGINTLTPWSTSEVIDRLGVPLSNIGVVARVGSDRRGVGGELAPLAFGAAAAGSSTHELVFRVKYDVQEVRYTVVHEATGRTVDEGIYGRIGGGMPVGIQFDLAGAPAGRYRIELDCLYEGRAGGPVRSFEFVHRP